MGSVYSKYGDHFLTLMIILKKKRRTQLTFKSNPHATFDLYNY